MFEDEAGFGRIFLPRHCWTPCKRPLVPAHHIREMRYAYGAVSPHSGEHFFLVMPRSDTACMNRFLEELSKAYPENYIVLICDNAVWHRSKSMVVPSNIIMLHIPPYTPEMNPIEQIWAELRRQGFVNQVFQTLELVVDRLCQTIQALTREKVKSITHRDWIFKPGLKKN